ncbi:unnamed protein product, partial [Prunus brigantina]
HRHRRSTSSSHSLSPSPLPSPSPSPLSQFQLYLRGRTVHSLFDNSLFLMIFEDVNTVLCGMKSGLSIRVLSR